MLTFFEYRGIKLPASSLFHILLSKVPGDIGFRASLQIEIQATAPRPKKGQNLLVEVNFIQPCPVGTLAL